MQFWLGATEAARGNAFEASEHFKQSNEMSATVSSTIGPKAILYLQRLRLYQGITGERDNTQTLATAEPESATSMAYVVSLLGRGYWQSQAIEQLNHCGKPALALARKLLTHPAFLSDLSFIRRDLLRYPMALKADAAPLLPVLVNMITAGNTHGLAGNAVATLGYFGPAAATNYPVLLLACEDSSRHIAKNARWALAQVGPAPPQCWNKIGDFLAHRNRQVQIRAAQALIAAGAIPPKHVPPLSAPKLVEPIQAWWRANHVTP
jgi:hypothetical protein